MRRFRYGVQVNSLGLTEAQPENNVQRIVLEMLGVTLSKNARARAVQLPAWNEALGLPRPWDQQWSCGCSRCWRTSRTCWSTTTSSRARS
jgi:(2R)-ethylmalonyl-CoA mutase